MFYNATHKIVYLIQEEALKKQVSEYLRKDGEVLSEYHVMYITVYYFLTQRLA